MTIRAELADGRVLEFPDGTDPAIIQTTVKNLLGESLGNGQPIKEPTLQRPKGDFVEASNPVFGAAREDGFVKGYQDIPAGVSQLASRVAPDGRTPEMVLQGFPQTHENIDNFIHREEDYYQQGRTAQGEEGFDWDRMGGNILNPLSVAPMATSGRVVSALMPKGAGMVKEGARVIAPTVDTSLMMGGYGASMPVVGGNNYAESKTEQIGFAAFLGILGSAATRMGMPVVKDLWNGFTQKGITQRMEQRLKEEIGDDAPKVLQAIKDYERRVQGDAKTTVADVLAQQSLKGERAGTADAYGGNLIKFQNDLEATGRHLKTNSRQSDLDMKKAIGEEGAPPEILQKLKEIRSKEANVNYAKDAQKQVPNESNKQLVTDALIKAEEKAAQKQNSRASGLQDWGKFKTLEAHQKNREPLDYSQRTLNKNIESELASRQGQGVDNVVHGNQAMNDAFSDAVKNTKQTKQPSRVSEYAENSADAKFAAGDALTIADQRAIEKGAYEDIYSSLLKSMMGASDKSMKDFVSRPSVIRAIKAAKEGADEAGKYFPTKEGDRFTVENLQRIKRAVADELKIGRKEGTLAATTDAEIAETGRLFTDWLRSKSSGFRYAEDEFAKASKPITRSEVSNALVEKAFPKLDKRTPSAYVKALDDPKFYKDNAKTGDTLEKIFPETASKKRAVAEALEEQAHGNNISQSAPSWLKDVDGRMTLQLPHILSRPIVITNAALKLIGRDLTPKYHKALEVLMTDVPRVERILKSPKPSEEKTMFGELIKKLSAVSVSQEIGREAGRN